MVALSASRLVCSAISVMSLTTSPMRAAASPSSFTAALVASASPPPCRRWCSTAPPAGRSRSPTPRARPPPRRCRAHWRRLPTRRLRRARSYRSRCQQRRQATGGRQHLRPRCRRARTSVVSMSLEKRAISADIALCRCARASASPDTVRLSSALCASPAERRNRARKRADFILPVAIWGSRSPRRRRSFRSRGQAGDRLRSDAAHAR